MGGRKRRVPREQVSVSRDTVTLLSPAERPHQDTE